jgi:phosphate/sulfate permease
MPAPAREAGRLAGDGNRSRNVLMPPSLGRHLLFIVLPFAVAAASAWNVIAFRLERLMDPRLPESVSIAMILALIAIGLLMALAISGRKAGRRFLLAASLAAIAVAGFAPRALHAYLEQKAVLEEQAVGAEAEMQWQAALLDRNDDLDQRVDDKRPFSAAQALDLAGFAADADLSWKGLMDHTPEAYDLLRQAIEARILDPNARGEDGKSVALAFYEARVKPNLASGIRVHDYEVLKILADGGLDLSAPEAADLKADLARKAVGDAGSRTVKLE